MARTAWDDRFHTTTRGQILTLLRKGDQTVDDLATALSLTTNAIRNHLYALERDGFVAQSGLRRGVGKPASVYTLTPAAERLFPKPYAAVLGTLIDVLGDRLPADGLEAVLVEAGRRLAAAAGPLAGSVDERLPAVMEVLAGMGGLAEVERSNGHIVIQGYDCPIASTVQRHPQACRVLQALLGDLLGQPVAEQCDRHDVPRCRFAVERTRAAS